ncbi:MAG: TldD/PmbA family protein, partial [Gammaproteobacteria bacterium]|nr:TldD/PmbA family protein [Gammaproteobacteria bacterium]
MSNNSKDNVIEQHFDKICGSLFAGLEAEETLALTLEAEESQFTRINGGKIRQTGLVNDAELGLDLIVNSRRATSSVTLCGDLATDIEDMGIELQRLREEVSLLPEDPYIVLPAGDETSRTDQQGLLLDAENSPDKLLPAMQGVDLSGIWASGRVYRGNANSVGSRHWFA